MMKYLLFTLLAEVLFASRLCAAAISDFFPWMSEHPVEIGMSSSDFRRLRPGAIDLSGRDINPREPFKGDLTESLPNGELFIYVLFDDKLESASWTLPPSPDLGKSLKKIRDALLHKFGEPVSGITGRVKAGGGVHQVIWEDYRPPDDKNYRITLKATSEDGIEVDLVNETRLKAFGRKISHSTFEEVVQSLPPSVQTSKDSAELIDLLKELRSEKTLPPLDAPDAQGIERNGQTGVLPDSSPLPKEKMRSGVLPVEPTAIPRESEIPTASSSVWLRWLGGLAVVVLAFIAHAIRKRRH